MSNRFVSLNNKEVHTSTGQICKSFCIAITVGMATLTSSGTQAQSQSVPASRWIESRSKSAIPISTYSINIEKTQKGKISISFKLKNSFGFNKVSQWAAVMNVERKTIYDWQKNPETKIQSKISDRIDILNKFHDEMTDIHRQYLAKFAFGKMSDEDLRLELTKNSIDIETLLDIYDRLYLDFDGRAKRNSLGVTDIG